MVRAAILAVAAGSFVAGCASPPPPAPPPTSQDVAVAAPQAAESAVVVGGLDTKVRVALPRLGPRAFAEIETRQIREPSETGGTERQIDSHCDFWFEEGALVGALAGWVISGETTRLESANLLASLRPTALDATHVRFEVDAAVR